MTFQKEVEQLREKLTGSSEDSAQTRYTSKVQEMQDQIQLMQVSDRDGIIIIVCNRQQRVSDRTQLHCK